MKPFSIFGVCKCNFSLNFSVIKATVPLHSHTILFILPHIPVSVNYKSVCLRHQAIHHNNETTNRTYTLLTKVMSVNKVLEVNTESQGNTFFSEKDSGLSDFLSGIYSTVWHLFKRFPSIQVYKWAHVHFFLILRWIYDCTTLYIYTTTFSLRAT